MARLHEYEGKRLLRERGLASPRGRVAGSPEEARAAAAEIVGPAGGVVLKIQAWTTGRAAIGGVAFADTPEEAAGHAARLLGMRVGAFPVEQVLVEEKIAIAREMFVSLFIDDRARAPAMLVSLAGGSGIEERAGAVARVACDVKEGPDEGELARLIGEAGLEEGVRGKVLEAIRAIFRTARECEARSLEVNPLVVTKGGEVLAADCRVTIDDYAVFRHPELGIEIARELDHPPTRLERIAYQVEQADHRGTFYFAQLHTEAEPGSLGLIGFHGAGGGGSMMSMDAITDLGGGKGGFTIANFTDTSGNPSAAKVYRAARIILSQPGLIGYFGSGSGVASQEQFWSAYGLAKAFRELRLDVPAVIRLGGNSEDRAVDIIQRACAGLPGRVEGYKKDDPPRKIAARFAELVEGAGGKVWTPRQVKKPRFVGAEGACSFEINGGRCWIDVSRWAEARDVVLANGYGLIADEGGRPVLTVTDEEVKGKDSELIACEIECALAGQAVLFVELNVPGLDEAHRGDR